MRKFYSLFIYTLSFLPSVALADSYSDLTFADLVGKIIGIINQVIPVLVSVTVFLLMVGITRYILTAGDSKNHRQGFELVMYGVFGLFIMLSVWGLINVAVSVLGLSQNGGVAP